MWSRAAQARVASRHLRGRIALLADPTRVQMLWAPRLAELDVASLAGVAGYRSTVASQHLSKLRFGGLAEMGHPHGQRAVYRLLGGHVQVLLTQALFPGRSPHQRGTDPRLNDRSMQP